ncbi:MAG TPA: hypothetical protein VKV74_17185 [Bryobacteraceae bacterium]|nr:hypothetical protein [Bryobacteraceae bacterium]
MPTRIAPRVNRILFSDAAATIVESLAGTTTVVSYVESAAGVAAGGRTGVASVVTGLMFAAALFFSPLFGAPPPDATAPALVIVGGLMLSSIVEGRLSAIVAISGALRVYEKQAVIRRRGVAGWAESS